MHRWLPYQVVADERVDGVAAIDALSDCAVYKQLRTIVDSCCVSVSGYRCVQCLLISNQKVLRRSCQLPHAQGTRVQQEMDGPKLRPAFGLKSTLVVLRSKDP